MRRPRKVILLVDGDEERLGRRRFLLETRGYRVIAVASSAAALEVLGVAADGELQLLFAQLGLGKGDGLSGDDLAARSKGLQPLLATLVVNDAVESYAKAVEADRFLSRATASPAEVLEAVWLLTARKRGPRGPRVAAAALTAVAA